ncbi:MAG: single-stranded-DNA-specific exonuclease RecJ, partial [Alphaproteobacteria bacterium]|nr:single-stranded-DNA-specific exonuclease RecJ [Alphaproteobacteria bacterium]
RSVTGRRWVPRRADERIARAIAQTHALPDILARVIAARGVAPEDVEGFLRPTLRAHLPDPSHLRDMDVAVARLMRAILADETVAVFGDYDVDGATSAALLARFFAAIGRPLLVYIPDRMREGYGPNAAALMALRDRGASVVVTVDCGTTAFDPLEAAREAGLDVIVVDHHVAEPRLPTAVAVVNPNRVDETSAHRHLAAVGVTFLLVVALNRALRDGHWYGEGHAEPDLRQWLDLVALGTVCDIVPLTGVNRALVVQGLQVMAMRDNAGLAALGDVARLTGKPDAYHLGFVFGPRVNAGGRVGRSDLGVRLLATEDAAEARAIAERLDGYNRERQAIEAAVLAAALEACAHSGAADRPLVMAAGEGWHPGVIGIVASRLRERFLRPVCVVAVEDGTGKGSGRSIAGVKLGAAVVAARQAGLLINGGGHDMAAGFTVASHRIAELEAFLADHVLRQGAGAMPEPSLSIDALLAPAAATPEFAAALDRVGPFGTGNPRPRFVVPDATVVRPEPVGEAHVRCLLAAPGRGARLRAIAFRAAGQPVGACLLKGGGLPVHVAGHLRRDRWQGAETVDLVIDDIAEAGANAE